MSKKKNIPIPEIQINEKRNDIKHIIFIILTMLGVYAVLCSFTGIWPLSKNPYNSYSLQASSWLSGRLDLPENYSHLEIAVFGGKYYISFPPFPSYIMLPFVMIFGTKTPDHLITMIAGIIGAVYLFKTFRLFKLSPEKSVILSLLATLGSNFLTLATSGYVWFIAQVFSFTLMAASFYYAAKQGKQSNMLSLLFWACAVGCRPFVALYIPIILYIIYKKENLPLLQLFKKLIISAIPCIIIAISYMILNYARFGSIMEFGHNYLPEFTEAEHGQFSLEYLSSNFATIFKIPGLKENSSVVDFPKFNGFAFYLVSPVFILYAVLFVRTLIKKIPTDKIILFGVPVLIFIHFIVTCCHRTLGGWHFGQRYTVDAIPALMLAIAYIFPDRDKYAKLSTILLLFGMCINAIGYVLLIIKAL